MNKAQKIVTGFLIISVLVIAVLYGFYYHAKSANNIFNSLSNQTILYYGSTCPHCKIVEEFIKNSSIETKINITQKEVYNNTINAGELVKVEKACKIEKDYIGAVPLLYSDKKCYLGDKDIISLLAKQLNLSVSA